MNGDIINKKLTGGSGYGYECDSDSEADSKWIPSEQDLIAIKQVFIHAKEDVILAGQNANILWANKKLLTGIVGTNISNILLDGEEAVGYEAEEKVFYDKKINHRITSGMYSCIVANKICQYNLIKYPVDNHSIYIFQLVFKNALTELLKQNDIRAIFVNADITMRSSVHSMHSIVLEQQAAYINLMKRSRKKIQCEGLSLEESFFESEKINCYKILRIATVISELMLYGDSTLEPTVFNLTSHLEQTKNVLNKLLYTPKNNRGNSNLKIDFEMDIEDNLNVIAEKNRLDFAMINVISHAIKLNNSSGIVKILAMPNEATVRITIIIPYNAESAADKFCFSKDSELSMFIPKSTDLISDSFYLLEVFCEKFNSKYEVIYGENNSIRMINIEMPRFEVTSNLQGSNLLSMNSTKMSFIPDSDPIFSPFNVILKGV